MLPDPDGKGFESESKRFKVGLKGKEAHMGSLYGLCLSPNKEYFSLT